MEKLVCKFVPSFNADTIVLIYCERMLGRFNSENRSKSNRT